MTESRRYVSPKREAQAAATREAILQAFAEQLSQPDRTTLSPSEAAVRAGVSVRTVHLHFPNGDSQITAIGEWFDAPDLEAEKAAIARVNRTALEEVVYAPTGFFLQYTAWRKNVSGIVKSPFPMFWGVQKT